MIRGTCGPSPQTSVAPTRVTTTRPPVGIGGVPEVSSIVNWRSRLPSVVLIASSELGCRKRCRSLSWSHRTLPPTESPARGLVGVDVPRLGRGREPDRGDAHVVRRAELVEARGRQVEVVVVHGDLAVDVAWREVGVLDRTGAERPPDHRLHAGRGVGLRREQRGAVGHDGVDVARGERPAGRAEVGERERLQVVLVVDHDHLAATRGQAHGLAGHRLEPLPDARGEQVGGDAEVSVLVAIT